MYEDQTIDVVMSRLLGKVDDKYNKDAGNLVYDVLKPCAIEISSLYQVIGQLENLLNVDNMSGDTLATYVYQRKGLIRKAGGYSTTTLDIQGNASINEGDLFSTNGNIQFSATETVTISGSGQVKVQCTQIGSVGNVPANTIVEMPITIPGITSVTNQQPLTDGFDAESDNNLRQRYYDAIQEQATSNNIENYEKWAKEVPGVGQSKAFSQWNGDLTVKVVIVDSNRDMPSQQLIDATQNYIDPKGVQDSDGNWSTWGKGYGQSSLGAFCTIAPPSAKTIDISVSITKDNNYTDEQIQQGIEEYLTGYFESITLDEENNYVSYAKVGNLIFNANGVADYSSLKMNNDTQNIPLTISNSECDIAVLGAVNITYV